jgi:hypothetical protein
MALVYEGEAARVFEIEKRVCVFGERLARLKHLELPRHAKVREQDLSAVESHDDEFSATTDFTNARPAQSASEPVRRVVGRESCAYELCRHDALAA